MGRIDEILRWLSHYQFSGASDQLDDERHDDDDDSRVFLRDPTCYPFTNLPHPRFCNRVARSFVRDLARVSRHEQRCVLLVLFVPSCF